MLLCNSKHYPVTPDAINVLHIIEKHLLSLNSCEINRTEHKQYIIGTSIYIVVDAGME